MCGGPVKSTCIEVQLVVTSCVLGTCSLTNECTVPLADWPLFHCTCRTGSSGGGGGWGGCGTAKY